MKRSGRTIVPLAVILLGLLFVGIQADAASPQVAVGHSIGSPDLAIAKTHSGSFTRGQTGATYTITVSNVGNGATTQAVSVTDTLPTGLTATDISGTGWSCTLETLTCTRSDTLDVFPNVVSGSPQALPRIPVFQGTYPVITVTVTVAGDAPSSVTNQASVSGTTTTKIMMPPM